MPDKRRTTIETLTIEQQAFLHNAALPKSSAHASHSAQTNGHNAVINAEKNPDSPRPHSPALSHRDAPRTTPSPRARRTVMRSVTLRLREPIARNLRRASVERSLEYKEPYTQQAIVDAALSVWLGRNGYAAEK